MATIQNRLSFGTIVIYSFLGFLGLIMVFPFYNLVIMSFATPAAIASQLVYLVPVTFDLSPYQAIFETTLLGNSILISAFVTLVGTVLNLFMTTTAGYVLSKRHVPGTRVLMGLIVVTMLFSGGLIPYYLTIRDMGLRDSLLVMILPTAIDTFYLLLAINFFRNIPASLEESAFMDGASDATILFRIILPVSAPMVAAIGLFYAVARWNEWWLALMFINDHQLQPMQYILRQMLSQISSVMDSSVGADIAAQRLSGLYPTSIKMAAIVITTLPILCVYPFIQKHFNKGVMLGSVKG